MADSLDAIGSPGTLSTTVYECNLKAVALKPSIRRISVREADAQRPPARYHGEEHRFRAERGLSQEALAHECGINRTYLSAVERAERNVSIDNIARIAKGLGVEPCMLLRDN
ncbi:MAG: helix-turn-helix transcriptional regulator [Methylocella sp.]